MTETMIVAMKVFSLLFMAVFASVGCNVGERKELGKNEARSDMLAYPYKADRERLDQIDKGVERVEMGTSSDEVIRLMGNPDEVKDLLDKDNWDKIIGFSFVYIKQRDKARGSLNEMNSDVIRIRFNKKKEVIQIYHQTPPGVPSQITTDSGSSLLRP